MNEEFTLYRWDELMAIWEDVKRQAKANKNFRYNAVINLYADDPGKPPRRVFTIVAKPFFYRKKLSRCKLTQVWPRVGGPSLEAR